MSDFNEEDIYVKIILPTTTDLLDKIYTIIYFMRKKIVRKNFCINNENLTVIYKIIENYFNKIDDAYINLQKNQELNSKYKIYYENAKLFLDTIRLIIIQLDKNNFYNDLYDSYYYFYNLISNDITSNIYSKNRRLLETLFSYHNTVQNKEIMVKLSKLEVDSYYYDNIYEILYNSKINIRKILKNFNLTNDLISSNIPLQQGKKYNEEEIINKKKKQLEGRKKKDDNCKLELNLKKPIINRENNFDKIEFEPSTNNENKLLEFMKEINNDNNKEEAEIEDDDEDDDIKEFKEELIKTFKENYEEFEYTPENRGIIKNHFNKRFDNGKINRIKNYKNNSIASLFSNFLSNNKKFIFSDNDRYEIVNYNEKEERDLSIDFRELRKNFIQSLINELFENKIFITDEREKNNKYFLNSNYKPDDIFVSIIKTNNRSFHDIYAKPENDREFIQDFYNFIANLITFLLFSSYDIDKEFSSYLIANFYKDEFNNYDYIYYLFKDFNNYTKDRILRIINIDSEDVNTTGIEFNGEYLLDKSKDDLTIRGSSIEIQYITELAKFLSFKTIEKTVDEKIISRGELINKSFTQSIPKDVRDEFKKVKNINNDLINKLFRGNGLNENQMTELFFRTVIFSIIKMNGDNNSNKIINQKKLLIFAYIIKTFFIGNLLELLKKNNNYRLKFSMNKKISTSKFYQELNNIEFPDYFIDTSDDDVNTTLIEISSITDENKEALIEKHKTLIEPIKTFFEYYNPKVEKTVGGRGRRRNEEYQLYIERKRYYIIYNNKKCYLTIDNIKTRNNNLFININGKYIKVIF
jgi:sulfur relay (sulfurtransferase) DsrC/TusE family protein